MTSFIVTVLVLSFIVYIAVKHNKISKQKKQNIILAAEERDRIAKEIEREKKERYTKSLVDKYGLDVAVRVINKSIFVGCPEELLKDMFGNPCDIDEKVTKNKVKKIFKFFKIGSKSFALRVTTENGFVVAYDDKRMS